MKPPENSPDIQVVGERNQEAVAVHSFKRPEVPDLCQPRHPELFDRPPRLDRVRDAMGGKGQGSPAA